MTCFVINSKTMVKVSDKIRMDNNFLMMMLVIGLCCLIAAVLAQGTVEPVSIPRLFLVKDTPSNSLLERHEEQIQELQQQIHQQQQKLLESSASAAKNDGDTADKDVHSLNILVEKLFKCYNKAAIPHRPIVVHVDVLLLKVKSTVEKEGIFESVIALFVEWNDTRMTWKPEEYDNLTVLAFDSDKVWLPDIAMTNAADHLYSISRDERFIVRVTYEGRFKFVPTGTARTWCDLKLLTFPFDYQTCSLEFESWSLDSSTMTFDGNSHLLVDESFASNQFFLCKQHVLTYHHTYEFTGETFTRVRFDFTVRRKSTFYIINLIFPCATLSFIQLLVFWISSCTDRIGFGTTNLLTLVVFQTIVTSEMPKTSDAVTALSKYVISLILISAVGILESVMVERMYSKSQQPPPKIILLLFRHIPVINTESQNTPKFKRKSKQSFHGPNSCKKTAGGESTSMPTLPYVISASAIIPLDRVLPTSNSCDSAIVADNSCNNEEQKLASVMNNSDSGNRLSSGKVMTLSAVAVPTSMEEQLRRISYETAITSGTYQQQQQQQQPNNQQPMVMMTPHQDSNNSNSLAVKVNFEFFKIDKLSNAITAGELLNRNQQQHQECCDEPKFPNNCDLSCFEKGSRLLKSCCSRCKRPTSSSPSATSADDEKLKHSLNARMWRTLALKLDLMTFVICATLAVAVPFSLFVPLLDFQEACSDESSGKGNMVSA